jgi:3'-5' exoribonuclease
VTTDAEGLTQGDDVLTLRIGDHEPDMKRRHPKKVVARAAARRAKPSIFSPARQPCPASCDAPSLMSQLLDIPALAPGDDVHHALVVVEVDARGGDHPRTTLHFGNRTGRIPSAPFWAGRDEQIRGIERGTVVQVVGKVTSYRDSNQLDAVSVRALPAGSVPLADLVPSVGPVEKYWQFIDEQRDKLTAPRLRAVLDLFYADDAFRQRYEQCPGAPGTGHHAALGGLLQHTCEVLAIALQIARVARADIELVVAGVLLHDIGKLDAYSWDGGTFETTEGGRLIGHVVQGVILLEQAFQRAGGTVCTPQELLLLEHFILSHHGKLEFGAAVKPLTLEAEILHFADDASAKTASINEAYSSKEFFPAGSGVSAKKIWQLDNRWMFKAALDFGRARET